MSFLRRFILHSPKRYLVGLLLAAALVLVSLFIRGFDHLIYYVDSFGIAGGAVFLIGMLQLVSYWGAFDTFGYSFSSFRHKSRYEDLYEYTVKKQESRRVNELTFMPFIVVGLVFLLICLILRLMM